MSGVLETSQLEDVLADPERMEAKWSMQTEERLSTPHWSRLLFTSDDVLIDDPIHESDLHE